MTNPVCLLIDKDEAALQELSELLNHHAHAGRVFSAATVASARPILTGERVDILFIRVKAWDEYRKILPRLTAPPSIVVFLSGSKEKSTLRLEKEVDFHLQSPYRPLAITRLFNRLKDPSFVPKSLDFFFLKANRQYYAVAFSALRAVSSKGRVLTVRTDKEEYQVAGSLSGLQDRLPPLFCRVGPSLLVPGAQVMGGYANGRAINLFAPY